MPLNIKLNSIQDLDDDWQAISLMIFIGDHVLFIKRSMDMPSFKGHLAFIGGMRKEGEQANELALREFAEETSLDSADLEVLGPLSIMQASNKLKILPVLCKLDNECRGSNVIY